MARGKEKGRPEGRPYPSRRKFLKSVGGAAAVAVAIPKLGGGLLGAAQVLEQAPEARARKRVPIRLRVNGSVYALQVEPRWTLLDVLRNHLHLTGAKKVCDRAECGACTVLVGDKSASGSSASKPAHDKVEMAAKESLAGKPAHDKVELPAKESLAGKPVYACMMLALEANDREIVTIEGLAQGGRLHPVQEAFLRNDALQCGFCTPGMILAVKALLERNPKPSLEEIRQGISGNLCKCGTYTKIFRAAREAGEMMRSGQSGRQIAARAGAWQARLFPAPSRAGR